MQIFRYAVQIKKKGIWHTVAEFNFSKPKEIIIPVYKAYRIWDKFECLTIKELKKGDKESNEGYILDIQEPVKFDKTAEECFQDLHDAMNNLLRETSKAFHIDKLLDKLNYWLIRRKTRLPKSMNPVKDKIAFAIVNKKTLKKLSKGLSDSHRNAGEARERAQ